MHLMNMLCSVVVEIGEDKCPLYTPGAVGGNSPHAEMHSRTLNILDLLFMLGEQVIFLI